MIHAIVVFIGLAISLIIPNSVKRRFGGFKSGFLSGWYKPEFKSFDGIISGKIELVGGKYISIGKGTHISRDARLFAWDNFNDKSYSPTITIGKNCRIGKDCMLSAIDRIEVGDNTAITARTIIVDNVHGEFRDHKLTFNDNPNIPDVFLQNVYERDLASRGPVIIEHSVHIGEGCVILPGVKIGHNSVVSANSVVTKKVPPYSIVAGNPAVVVLTFGK